MLSTGQAPRFRLIDMRPAISREPMDFTSDNTVGVSQPILEAIVAANKGASAAYGDDAYSADASDRLREVFETDLSVFLVSTGTGRQRFGARGAQPALGAVFCHETAHVMEDECGAPEMFTGGAKMIGVGGRAGKIAADDLAAALARYPRGTRQTGSTRGPVVVAGDRVRHGL